MCSQPTDTENCELLKHERSIDWMVEILQESIRLIIAQRQAKKTTCTSPLASISRGGVALDEVVEAIKLPDFDAKAVAAADADSVEISDHIHALLREYVAIVSDCSFFLISRQGIISPLA
jgi:hypothetical protein